VDDNCDEVACTLNNCSLLSLSDISITGGKIDRFILYFYKLKCLELFSNTVEPR